jgi:bacterioferritin-associated ferredoxin
LELLEKTAFPFASGRALQYLSERCRRITPGPAAFMIVCSCNVLTDHDVRSAVSTVADFPRSAKQVYGCLGCSAECGRCARTIKSIIDEALGTCAEACCSGCPHSRAGADSHVHNEFALAAS